MSNLETPRSILEQILDEMFLKLDDEDSFNLDTLYEIRKLAYSNSLIKGNELLDILKESGDSGEDP